MNIILPKKTNMTVVFGLAMPPDTLPEPLTKLADSVVMQTEKALDAAGANKKVKWKETIHPTGIGCEGGRIAGKLYNANFLNNRGELRTPDLLGLCNLMREMTHDGLLFQVRFGGFRRARCTCSEFSRYSWECDSGAEFHSCDRSAYEGSFYVANGPVIMTGWPVEGDKFSRALYGLRLAAEHFGFCDKYHSTEKSHWKDDDFYVRLGTMGDVSPALVEEVEESVRGWFSRQSPVIVPVKLADARVVLYSDSQIEKNEHVLARHSVDELLANPSIIERLWARVD